MLLREVWFLEGRHRGADLDGVNGCPSAEKVAGRLPGTGPDFKDCRMARQEPKQVLEHGRWVVGPYPV
jgi:hypothetical protein